MQPALSRWNTLSADDFSALLGNVYEHSPWIAREAAARRPFSSGDELLTAFRQIVDAAPSARRMALIRAHPDLAGRLARLGKITAESRREQAAAGIDSLDPAALTQLTADNAVYRRKFGFPFILCARNHSAAAILESLARRLGHDPETEITAALGEIHQIARHRLHDLLCQEN